MGKGQLAAVAGASLSLLFRLGTGVFVAGYKPGLKDKSSSEYSLGDVGGKGISEVSVCGPHDSCCCCCCCSVLLYGAASMLTAPTRQLFECMYARVRATP